MATKKKPGRKAPARKVAAVSRLREGLAKKKREPAHILEDVKPQTEFDFRALGDAGPATSPVQDCAKQAAPEPGAEYRSEKYSPYRPQYEGRDNSIPDTVELQFGRTHIRLTFR